MDPQVLGTAGTPSLQVPERWEDVTPEWMTAAMQMRFRRLYELQESCGISLVTMVIRYLIADPVVTAILIGAATPAEVEESVAAAQQGRLPEDMHQAIEELGLPQQEESD